METDTSLCHVLELTEREHLILAASDKWWKTCTRLSSYAQKLHNVNIHFMKSPREVHISGGNYHAGIQELFKEIKRTTTWWEHQRGKAGTSVVT